MKIYIASSWKNQHAVEMLTGLLRHYGYTVASFIENNYGEGHGPDKPMDFDAWVNTPQAAQAFDFDVLNATRSDLVIYIGPSGTDAWAEVGAAYASGVAVWGLWAKGEKAGLMRKMVNRWFTRGPHLLHAILAAMPAHGPLAPVPGTPTAMDENDCGLQGITEGNP